MKGLILRLDIRHDHVVELLCPLSVEVRHLKPVGLILNADIAQLNKDLRRLDVVTTVPLKRRSQRRFYFSIMYVQAIEGGFVFLLTASTKDDLCPRSIIVGNAAQIESSDTEEPIDPVIPRRIDVGEGAILAVRLLDDGESVCPVSSAELVSAARLVRIGFILVPQVKYQVCRVFVIQLEQTAQDRQLALRAGVRPHMNTVADLLRLCERVRIRAEVKRDVLFPRTWQALL